MLVSGSWLTAARWSSRLDFRPLVSALDGGPRALARAGAPPAFVKEAAACPPAEVGAPLRSDAEGYPAALLELAAPPPLLWAEGSLEVLTRPALAIVGARACTPYGRLVAGRLAREVSQRGGVVVSGGARGVDSAAHSATFDGGATVAVLGGGLESAFTSAQGALHQGILSHGGLLLSEQPPLDRARRWTFPRRNRLIAALGCATVVVEAAEGSGSLHTARAAHALGRDVLAVPGRLGEAASAGCLELIAQGALCVTDLNAVADRVGQPMSRRLAGLLPATPSELADGLEQEPRAVMGLLAMLELRGIVRRMRDGRYGLR